MLVYFRLSLIIDIIIFKLSKFTFSSSNSSLVLSFVLSLKNLDGHFQSKIFNFFDDFDKKTDDKTNDSSEELFDKIKNFEKNKKIQINPKKIKEQFLLIKIYLKLNNCEDIDKNKNRNKNYLKMIVNN